MDVLGIGSSTDKNKKDKLGRHRATESFNNRSKPWWAAAGDMSAH